MSEYTNLAARVARLETTSARWRLAAIGAGAALIAVCGAGLTRPDEPRAEAAKEIRARRIVIVDEKGVERIELAAPIVDPEGMNRMMQITAGMIIRDETGAERFGLSIDSNNRISMGFDAPVGVGSPMRDRLALGVTAEGASYVNLISNKTGIPVRLVSEPDGSGGVEFVDYDYDEQGNVTVDKIKRIEFRGTATAEYPRKK